MEGVINRTKGNDERILIDVPGTIGGLDDSDDDEDGGADDVSGTAPLLTRPEKTLL